MRKKDWGRIRARECEPRRDQGKGMGLGLGRERGWGRKGTGDELGGEREAGEGIQLNVSIVTAGQKTRPIYKSPGQPQPGLVVGGPGISGVGWEL